MKSNKRKITKIVMTICIIIAFCILREYISLAVDMFIALDYPCLRYDGNKTVSEDEIILLEKFSIRDLKREDVCIKSSDGTIRCWKHYIVKKNHLMKKKVKSQLLEYCKDFYAKNDSYNSIDFYFYEECGTLPWYWNGDGFFPDLETNSAHLIYHIFINETQTNFEDTNGAEKKE